MSGNAAAAAPRRQALKDFLDWARRINLERKLALGLMIAAIASGIATYWAMTGESAKTTGPRAILILLNLDLALLLGLGVLVLRRMVALWTARRRGIAGARLHSRLAVLFGLVAVTPTIVVSVFSVLYFSFALQGWFSDRVSTAVEESFAVAKAYLEEHRQTIAGDALAMAQDLNREGQVLLFNRARFTQFLAAHAALRSLTEAVVFDSSGRVLGRAGIGLLLDFDPAIPDWAFQQSNEGEVVILTADTDDRVRALVRLDAFENTFLVVGRLVDPRVLAHTDRASNASTIYKALEKQREGFQITFAAIFVVVALLLLMAATWVGLAFANQLSRPIQDLIAAANQVRQGDLAARVPEPDSGDEIGWLSRAFNRMTGQLESQQRALIDANKELDQRGRFTEAVLSGVSAGVIGLDHQGRITLPNRSACELLSEEPEELRGKRLGEVIPELRELLDKADNVRRDAQHQITLNQPDGTTRTLLVRITTERGGHGILGFVVTFDDISELMSAQRKAAWADIARRIAHEIKNPLTPIQLSAERLKRKYLDEIQSDKETFEICTDTIVRHVGDIGRMVNEFSNFARMPAPVMQEESLTDVIRQAVFLQRSAHSGIRFDTGLPEAAVMANFDRQQISQALTNLLQNAVEAIEERVARDGEPDDGEIRVSLEHRGETIEIRVEDNGKGLPKKDRDRLTEPYITTRKHGTGLGLAIVKKIMEDHGGDLRMADREGGGATVCLFLRASEGQGIRRPETSVEETPDQRLAKAGRHGA